MGEEPTHTTTRKSDPLYIIQYSLDCSLVVVESRYYVNVSVLNLDMLEPNPKPIFRCGSE